MKIGLFFGTFNPIHSGHLMLAEGMLNYTDLDQVWFVVTPQNPSKTKQTLLADFHRLNMVRDAISENIRFRDCDIEFSLNKPSYTAVTLGYLTEKYPAHSFDLILGEDNLRNFHKWFNFETILKNHRILVYPREKQENEYGECPPVSHENILLLPNVPVLQISSSQIRQLVLANKSIKYLVPDSVARQIQEMGFYR